MFAWWLVLTRRPIPHSRPWITESELERVRHAGMSRLLDGSFYADTFHAHLNRWTSCDSTVVSRSGTTALSEILSLVPDEPRREAILPTYVCRQVWDAVSNAGFRPVLVDVCDSGLLDLDSVEASLSQRTRIVIAVDLFGYPADTSSLSNLIATRGLRTEIIRDSCHSSGDATRVDFTESALATFYSFGATKLWTAGGAGGAYTVHSEGALGGRSKPILRSTEARTFPLSGLECSFGIAQLERYGEFRARRREIQSTYNQASPGLRRPTQRLVSGGDLYRYTFLARQGFEFAEAWFAERGIVVRRGVDALLHRLPEARSSRQFPQAETLYKRQVSVPFYPALDDVEVERVAEALAEYPR